MVLTSSNGSSSMSSRICGGAGRLAGALATTVRASPFARVAGFAFAFALAGFAFAFVAGFVFVFGFVADFAFVFVADLAFALAFVAGLAFFFVLDFAARFFFDAMDSPPARRSYNNASRRARRR